MLTGDQIGIDVVGLAIIAYADGRNDWDEITRIEKLDQLGIDLLDLSHQSDIDELVGTGLALEQHFASVDEGAILPGKAHRSAPVLVDQPNDLLVELPQHHLNHIHDSFVGNPHALTKFARDAHRLQYIRPKVSRAW